MTTAKKTWRPMVAEHNASRCCIRTAVLFRAISAAIWLLCLDGFQAAQASPLAIDFNRDIRPILSDKCIRCHGPDSGARQAELRLDRERDVKADRGKYAVVVPGEPEKSELYHRITNPDTDARMPPEKSGKKLSPEEIELLRRWIAEGAVWMPAWAYVAPKQQTAPATADSDWPSNWIDRYMLARLSNEQLHPSPDASKTTLIRRLSIDLVGLPPTPAEVHQFLADDRPDAYERLIDRLLASPHFGERMAMYWLDLVRYADTVGYHGDQEQNISPYRDYVIDAFNENMPFDQFTREQLAGDLLPHPTMRQTIATGYNRLLQTSHEGGIQKKEYLAIYAADRVRNFSNVWMGATMGCAQCHDHKYDPYTTKDFYAMQAFFADIDEDRHLDKGGGVDKSPTVREPEMELPTDEQKQQIAEMDQRLQYLQKLLDAEKSKENDATQEDQNDDPKSKLPAASDTVKNLQKKIAGVREQLKAAHAKIRRTMITVAKEPRVIRILPRGNWMDASGAIVEPAIPEFQGQLKTGQHRPTRLDLANWLIDSESGIGGLTARVMVNRFWYLMFGRGLAPVLDDFGGQGQPPTNPELLDALAVEFVNSGWDTKHMLKLIALSHAYRQSSSETVELRERDPLNQWFARQSRFRFPAEVVRDSSLAVSGLLVTTIDGPSVKPYQPPGYYRHLNFPEREYQSDNDDRQWRRGVYMHWQRQYLHPMLKAFDAPSREECTAQRPRSNTPLAALVLLNDPTFVEAARAFAARILHEGGATTDERLNFAFDWAVSRSASDDERKLLQSLLASSQSYYAEHAEAVDKLLSIGLKPAPADLNRAELASWTIVARTILSMNEALTRN
jgi:Protein of unknown function (DUF1553)/Protein of unknown function (DUF1549)/Planctomycete cytochrome C